jgi:hypothetical protein
MLKPLKNLSRDLFSMRAVHSRQDHYRRSSSLALSLLACTNGNVVVSVENSADHTRDHDRTGLFNQSELLYDALKKAGVDATFVTGERSRTWFWRAGSDWPGSRVPQAVLASNLPRAHLRGPISFVGWLPQFLQ